MVGKLLECTVELPGAAVPSFTLSYDPDSEVQRGMHEDISSGRMYETGTWETFRAILRPGDTFVDVGAHVGTFSALAAALVGDEGEVVAFEPDNANRKGWYRNVDHFASAVVCEEAVSDTNGYIPFYKCRDNDGGHAIYPPGNQGGNPKSRANPARRMARCTTLDSLLLSQCRLLKIDVEGAECSVLRGAQGLIAGCRPAIIAEQNTPGQMVMGDNEDYLRGLVRRHGYREYAIQDSAPHLVPLTKAETVRPMQGKAFVTFNWCLVPNEWPELVYG